MILLHNKTSRNKYW